MSRRGRLSQLFTWRSAVTDEGSSASALERHVALTLSMFMSEAGDSAFPAMETLAARCGRSASTVRGALRELERNGWLEVELNRGRGNTNRYRATIPDPPENHLTAAVSVGGDAAVTTGSEDAETASAASRAPGVGEAPETTEKRLSQAVSGKGKTAAVSSKTTDPAPENHRGPVPTTSGPRQDHASSSTDAAAAAGLEMRLRRHRVSRDLVVEAVADHERALAWLELAESEATANIAGFWIAGFRSGEWPSGRGETIQLHKRRSAREASLRNWINGGADVDEARYWIDHEWADLTTVERAELHELVDELLHDRLPDPAAATAGETEAGAGAA